MKNQHYSQEQIHEQSYKHTCGHPEGWCGKVNELLNRGCRCAPQPEALLVFLTAQLFSPPHWLTTYIDQQRCGQQRQNGSQKRPSRLPAATLLHKCFIQRMSKEASLSVTEREFILEALRQDTRLDGRRADQFRPLKISFGEEYGHVKLELGETRYTRRRFLTIIAWCLYADRDL